MNKIILIIILIAGATAQLYTADLLSNEELAQKKLYFSITEAAANAEEAYRLCLGDQELKELYDEIGELKKLQEINFSQNYIQRMPERICEMPNLQEIRAAANELKELPACLPELQNLKSLELANNPQINWEHAFRIISGLKHLEYLDLSFCGITQMPESLKNLSCLREIDLTGNEIPMEEIDKLRKIMGKVNIIFVD